MTNTAEVSRAVRSARKPLRRETAAWQTAVAGLFALSVLTNAALGGLYGLERQRWESDNAALQAELAQAEKVRDHAVRELGSLAAETARDRQARAEQARAYEAVGKYSFLGTCKITAYYRFSPESTVDTYIGIATTILGVNVLKVVENIFEHNDGPVFGHNNESEGSI